MQKCCQDQQPKRHAAKQSGLGQPAQHRDHKRDDVQDHAQVKRLKLVKEHLEIDLGKINITRRGLAQAVQQPVGAGIPSPPAAKPPPPASTSSA